jgi:hypothetical protein
MELVEGAKGSDDWRGYPSLKLLLVTIPKWDWAPGTKLELKIAGEWRSTQHLGQA